jgi:hypothetical protein
MVEIPNKLNALLRDCRAAEEVYEKLRGERCLSKNGRVNRAAAVASIEEGEAEWRRELADPGFCGGSREWYVVAALMRDGHLNNRASKLMSKSLITEAKPWWQIWR